MTTTARLLAVPALLALALSCGAQAQAAGTGTSASGAPSAPSAQGGTGTRNTPKAKLDRHDRKFVEDAASDGMFEVQMGQLAAGKATDPKVKEYAQMLVQQHTQANNELTQLANAKGWELPAAPKHSLRREIDKLGKKSGADFDRDYVRNEVKDHEKDIKKFQHESKDAKDADLKAWVDKNIPVLQQHLAAGEQLPESGRKNAAAMGAGGK